MESVARYIVELIVGLIVAVTVVEVLALAYVGLRRLLHRNWGPYNSSPGAPAESPA